MSFYPQFNGTVIVITLFNHLEDKPLLRRACLDVFETTVNGLIDGEDYTPVGEGHGEIRCGALTKTLLEAIDDYVIDDSDRAETILREYGMARALRLFGENHNDHELAQIWECDNPLSEIAKWILQETFFPLAGSDVWTEVIKYLTRDGVYHPDSVVFELESL